MASVVGNWAEVIRTQNLSSDKEMDAVSRWLLITRASVFPMTLTSALVGGLLALAGPTPVTLYWLYFAEALVGVLLAHAANNMINDYFDLAGGVDSDDYVRGQYAPHPILSGLISKGGLVTAIALVNLVDLAILVHLTSVWGWPVAAFALSGLFISVFYVAPPLKLKHRGLGEPGVFIVWGPLMIAGTFFVSTGQLPPWVWAASIPYAILVTTVLFGKHVDKLPADTARGIHTLPVILGDERARWISQVLMVSFFVAVGLLVLTGTFGVWTLLSFGAVPRLLKVIKVFGQPPPESAPPGYPIWPLWYVAWAFTLTRLAGGLLILGLIANAVYPIFL
ncbi:MAG: prenyltransferase [Deltaproteobacteria bacterium]|nr:prenyltransferase [Deltaproteobacteria bacterium]